MKLLLKIAWISCFPLAAIAQQNESDSLRLIINQHKRDTVEVNTLVYLAHGETQKKLFDSSLHHLQMARDLAIELEYESGKAHCLIVESNLKSAKGDFAGGIQDGLDALTFYKKINNVVGITSAYLLLQGSYWNVGEYRTALNYSLPGERFARENNVIGFLLFNDSHMAPLFASEIAQVYVLMNNLDSALYWVQRSIDEKELFGGTEWNFP